MHKDNFILATDQRAFTLIYDDFLESDRLTPYEKLVFIYLKKYADKQGQCFPSLNTLSKTIGLSKRKIQDCIKSMQDKGILRVEQRRINNRQLTSNLYTLHDTADIWKKKEKELSTEPDKATEESSHNSYTAQYNSSQRENQVDRYTMTDLHEIYGYDAVCAATDEKDADAVFNIIYDTLNTRKSTIRVDKEERPTMIVISRLMKLDYSDICYVIQKYNEQSDRIGNPTAYILTQLYHAKEQNHLDLMNLGHSNGDF